MTLKKLAEKYHYKEKLETRDKSQLIINFLGNNWDVNNGFAKAMNSFEVYLGYYRKQDILKAKGVDPKKHREYRLVK